MTGTSLRQALRSDEVREAGELLERHDRSDTGRDLSAYADDPVGFIRDVLGEELTEYQERIARSVLEHPLLTIRSCHAAGKDWLAARVSLWWVYARGGLVILTGPTAAQVEEILMRGEIRTAFRGSGLPGDLHVKALRPGGAGKAGILAKTATGVSSLTGFHDARVLFVITEAQDPEIEHAWDAAFACTTGSEDRVLTLGNPTHPEGRFYRAHQPGSDWHTVKIEASDVPNVRQDETVVPGLLTREGVERFRAEYGEESGFCVSRLLAEFPDEAVDALNQREWLETSTERHRRLGEPSGPYYVVGVDPARHGPDETVCCIRRGEYVCGFESWQGEDTQESARRVLNLVRRLHDGGASPVEAVCVDSIGLGAGVVDRLEEDLDTTWMESGRRGRRLREKHTRVVAFNSSKAAPDSGQYTNTRSQAFWHVRKRLEAGELDLPDDPKLMEELMAFRVEYTAKGRTKIGSKDRIKARIGRSPDRADSLAISLRPELREADEGIPLQYRCG